MNRIVIITATYNHSKNINKLYHSLLKQLNKNFRWIIVNDGSSDDTDDTIREYINDGIIDIIYINKKNSGKSSSLNQAFEIIAENEMVVIIDDDEVLDEDAVAIMEQYYNTYYNSNVGVIHFHRRNAIDNSVIANYPIDEDLHMDYITFKSSGRNADGYLVYFAYAINNIRFPVYPNEKYVAPSVLIMKCCEKYDMIWAKAVIGTTEYLEGGITKQGRTLRLKNPLGMMTYCELFQRSGVSFKVRIKYSIMGYAYKYLSKKNNEQLLNNQVYTKNYLTFCKPFGILLGYYWKRKHG